ncbi:unnamed protein product, partial [Symbiodinium pilosum]
AMLAAVTFHFPGLARWVAWCYHAPTRLCFGERTAIPSELRAGPLDLALFYLDDGVLDGDIAHVVAALAHLQQRGAQLGLHLNLAKCEVVAVVQSPDGSSRVQRDFELLGAAIGAEGFVAAHTAARATAAEPLLNAIADLEDPQVGLRLLRACAGHCRMVHSMRCSPPSAQGQALQAFDSLVRACFAGLTGLHLDEAQWAQASRGLSQAGLGLRATAVDAPAAYLASLGGCATACRELDPQYGAAGLADQPHAQQAAAATPSQHGQKISAVASATPSRWRSSMVKAAASMRLRLAGTAANQARAPASASERNRARPTTDALVRGHRLLQFAGGERNQRHNSLRDLLASWAARAGLQPELEKPGLLLPQRPEDARVERRRPADVYLPALARTPAALDLAVTAPQRQESLAQAGQQSLAAAASYAEAKAAHLQTARACAEQGVRFIPLVAEATGAWDKEASKTLLLISRAVAAREEGQPALVHAEMLQEFSVLLRAHRARAILRRRAEALAVNIANARLSDTNQILKISLRFLMQALGIFTLDSFGDGARTSKPLTAASFVISEQTDVSGVQCSGGWGLFCWMVRRLAPADIVRDRLPTLLVYVMLSFSGLQVASGCDASRNSFALLPYEDKDCCEEAYLTDPSGCLIGGQFNGRFIPGQTWAKGVTCKYNEDIMAFRATCASIPGSYTESSPGICTEAGVPWRAPNTPGFDGAAMRADISAAV